MKKFLKIIYINMFILAIVFVAAEVIAYTYSVWFYKKMSKEYNYQPEHLYKYKFFMQSFEEEFRKYEQYMLRQPCGINYKKSPIVLFGCSFCYGTSLQDNETFGYKLSEYTKRPVYNRGLEASGIQHSILQFEYSDFYSKIKNPEYVFFLYNPALHTHRLYEYTFMLFNEDLYPRFINKNGELVIVGRLPKIIEGLYLTKSFYKYRVQKEVNFDQSNIDFTILHFKKLQEEIYNHWKNTKFVILFYPYQNDILFSPNYDNQKYIDKIKSAFEKNNLLYLDIADIVDVNLDSIKYQISDSNNHPTAEVWDIVVPKLAEKLKL